MYPTFHFYSHSPPAPFIPFIILITYPAHIAKHAYTQLLVTNQDTDTCRYKGVIERRNPCSGEKNTANIRINDRYFITVMQPSHPSAKQNIVAYIPPFISILIPLPHLSFVLSF